MPFTGTIIPCQFLSCVTIFPPFLHHVPISVIFWWGVISFLSFSRTEHIIFITNFKRVLSMKWDYIVKSFPCVTFSLLLLIKKFFNLFLPCPLLLLWFHHVLWHKTLIVEFLCCSVSLVASLVDQDNANKIKEKSTFQCDMTWAKWNPEIQGHSMGHKNLVVVTINNLSFCIPVVPWLHLHNMHCKNEHTPYVFLNIMKPVLA